MRDASRASARQCGRVQGSGFWMMGVGSWKKGWEESREKKKEKRNKNEE